MAVREQAEPSAPRPETVGLLDSISLTAIYTDPTPPETAPSTNADDLLATVSLHVAPDPEVVDVEPRVREDGCDSGRIERHASSWRKLAIGVAGLALVGGGLAAGLGPGDQRQPAARTCTWPTARRPIASSAGTAPSTSCGDVDARPRLAPGRARRADRRARGVRLRAVLVARRRPRSSPSSDLSTIAYFSVDVNPNGSIDMSGPGWDGYESQDLTDLVNAAHQAGDRVVLTATDFSQSSLDTLTHDPIAGVTLGVS